MTNRSRRSRHFHWRNFLTTGSSSPERAKPKPVYAICYICDEKHQVGKFCPFKPAFPPNAKYPKCELCFGYHPEFNCYFEHMRPLLTTPTSCRNCYGLVHIGYCNDAVLCRICEKKHNERDGCKKVTHTDLSNNLCPECDCHHSLHCTKDLYSIKSNLVLWCNYCKTDHQFMKCIPFCIKCLRRHELDIPCPWPYPIPLPEFRPLQDSDRGSTTPTAATIGKKVAPEDTARRQKEHLREYYRKLKEEDRLFQLAQLQKQS